MKRLFASVLLLLSGIAWGQGAAFSGQAIGINSQGNLVPIPGASVLVCVDKACGSQVPIYSDATLGPSVQLNQPISADAGGNYSFFAAPSGAAGTYWCAINAPGFSGTLQPCPVAITGTTATPLIFSTSGIFTDSQMNQYDSSSIGGVNFATEFQTAEGGHAATEGLSGGVKVTALGSPPVLQANGVAGYANCGVAGGIGTGTDCFGGYFQSHATANSANVFGINAVSFDDIGLTSHVKLFGNELTVAPRNNASAYDAVNGLNVVLNGVAGQSYFPSIQCQSQSSATWSSCVFSNDGAAQTAFVAGASATSGTVASQPIQLNSFISNVEKFSAIQADTAANIVLTPGVTGASVLAPASGWTETTAPNAASGKDICYGDSTAHTEKCSYNNGTFYAQSQTIASGTATMTTAAISAGTCGSTVTVSAAGIATTDTIESTPNAAVGANPGVLIIQKWPTANNVNFAYCNPTAGSVTPSAATLNWRVAR